jgi:Transposase DDE domain group 1
MPTCPPSRRGRVEAHPVYGPAHAAAGSAHVVAQFGIFPFAAVRGKKRPGKTPSGVEVRGHVHRLVRAIRRHWSTTRITIRGDGHYRRPEVMDWCEANGVDYVFGLTGTKTLATKIDEFADAIRVARAIEDKDAVCVASFRP